MILTLHGTGAGTPSGDRSSSATTLRFDSGRVVLLDAGDACARSLIRDGIDINRIELIAISHMHSDHWSGLPGLITGWGTLGREDAPVEILVPPGTVEFFKSAQLHSLSFPENLPFDLTFRGLAPFDAGDGWHIEPFPTNHLAKVQSLARQRGASTPAHGYLLMKGSRRVVLSQDIGDAADLAPHMIGAELVICEASHADPEKLLLMAREARVRMVVFTHVSPKPPRFPLEVEQPVWCVASDGMMIGLA